MYGKDGLLTIRLMDKLQAWITTAYHDHAPIPLTLRSSLFTTATSRRHTTVQNRHSLPTVAGALQQSACLLRGSDGS
jgi:hypothetical protein